MNVLYLETLTLEVLFRYIVFFLTEQTLIAFLHHFTLLTILPPLAINYPLYFIFNTFFHMITATIVNIWCLLLVQILKELKSGLSLSLKVVSLVFSFFIFFSASLSFVSLLLAAANKRILLSWELITVFLPTLTSLKYTHVSK